MLRAIFIPKMARTVATDELPLPKLLDGERITYVEQENEYNVANRVPSGLEAMELLAKAKNRKQIGDFGPVLASLSLSVHGKDPAFHLYEAVFGRDSLRTAYDLIEYYPKLAKSTLLALAAVQGVMFDTAREEEPGRIPHEVRDPRSDPRARMLSETLGWGWPYYGAVDVTPEFVRTLAAYCRLVPGGAAILNEAYTGRDGATHVLSDALLAAVEWIQGRLSANTEGLLEFKRSNPNGLPNQVWKDSWDAYFHADGEIANHEQGIASIEVQAAVYDALLDVADLCENCLNKRSQAVELRRTAERLRLVIMELFWDEHERYFVLGLDRDKAGKIRQLKVMTSNMGHILHSRVLAGDQPDQIERREAVIRHLLSPAMLGLNGIRTLSNKEIRYRPGAYHNGSVWIWDNYFIAQGLSVLGYHNLAHFIDDRLLADITATRRFPEYLRGDNDPDRRLNSRIVRAWDKNNQLENTIEQPPQDIQAWSVASILAIHIRRQHGQHQTTDPVKLALEQELLAPYRAS